MQEIKRQIALGHWARAEALCRSALESAPRDPHLRFVLAFILWRQSRDPESLDLCKELIHLEPDDPALLNDLGNLARELGEPGLALTALDRSLLLRAGETGTLFNRALALDDLDKPEAALEIIDQIGPQDTAYADSRYLAGTIRQELGALEMAERNFRECLEASPGHPQALLALARVRSYPEDDPLFGELRGLLSGVSANREKRRHYLFALAKMLDDSGRYAEAFDCVSEANGLVDAPYPEQEIERRVAALKKAFAEAPNVEKPPDGQMTPLFVVGLPRSGTTLTEMFLERHPEICALGELDALPTLLPDPGAIPAASELPGLASSYLRSLPHAAHGYRFAVDKMPGNFWRLGHIAAMFPAARIIHCRREPADVAISNFFNLYNSGNSFAYSLSSLGHYAACHDAIMEHWKQALSDRVLQVKYEALVKQPEQEMSRIMQFIGLDWHDARAESNYKRRIRTASNQQVREAIHSRSIGRWRNYPEAEAQFSAAYNRQCDAWGLQ